MAQPNADEEGGFPLKLLVDGKTNKLVFAEAGKELVDFFFSVMQLPLGGAVSLLGKSFPGSMWELHNSIRNLNSSYFSADPHASSSEVQSDLTYPPLPFPSPRLGALHLPGWDVRKRLLRVYICYDCKNYLSEVEGAKCLSCSHGTMDRTAKFVLRSGDEGTADLGKEKGFVKEMVPYAITDDLSIAPLSTISNLALMKRLQVNELAALQERTVVVGVEQGLKILEISLRSKPVLSDVFLSKDEAPKKTGRFYYDDDHDYLEDV